MKSPNISSGKQAPLIDRNCKHFYNRLTKSICCLLAKNENYSCRKFDAYAVSSNFTLVNKVTRIKTLKIGFLTVLNTLRCGKTLRIVLQALILRLHFQKSRHSNVAGFFLVLLQPLHNGAALAFTPSVCYYIPQRQISTGGFYADKGSIGLQSGRPACGKGAGSSV